MFFLRIPKKYRIFAKKLKKRYLKVKLKYEGPMYEGCTKERCMKEWDKKREPKLSFCEPAGARTQDPILKRDVLYLLSY